MMEDSEYDDRSIDGSMEDEGKDNNEGNDGVNQDSEAIPKTVFDNLSEPKGDKSDDPFGLYSLLNKKTKAMKDKNQSPIYPPGFTPDNEEIKVGEGVFDNKKSKGDKGESISSGQFKKSEAPRSRGSFLNLMEEVVNV
nr:nucleotide-binding alpha-beta plait domain-containing protein [Tanacetum cinerariifolium]